MPEYALDRRPGMGRFRRTSLNTVWFIDIPERLDFRRDRLTWLAYALLAWFAYLQAAPGLVVAHLRDELDLSYSAGGLHVAAFAAGSVVAGVALGRAGARARAPGAVLVLGGADGRGCGRAHARAHAGGDDRLAARDGRRRRRCC